MRIPLQLLILTSSALVEISKAFSSYKQNGISREVRWNSNVKMNDYIRTVSRTSRNTVLRNYNERNSIWDKIASSVISPPPITNEQGFAKSVSSGDGEMVDSILSYMQAITLVRVGLPASVYAIFASIVYSPLSKTISHLSGFNHDGVFLVVSQDSSQFIQNILTTCGLMFSIMVGYTYYFMYQQQEGIYIALFDEVSETKSLLEQVSLVLGGRRSTYENVLGCIEKYVNEDLKCVDIEPAELLSARPIDDPLESIMFYTSVGEPSIVYDTVRSLRQARSRRLGSLQRKLPDIHMILLYSLAFVVLSSFPILGAGVQVIGGDNILHVQSVYFAIMVFGIVIALGIINELRKPVGGIYNTDALLSVMTQGLEEELELRISGLTTEAAEEAPTVDSESDFEKDGVTINVDDDENSSTSDFSTDKTTGQLSDPSKISLKTRFLRKIKRASEQ